MGAAFLHDEADAKSADGGAEGVGPAGGAEKFARVVGGGKPTRTIVSRLTRAGEVVGEFGFLHFVKLTECSEHIRLGAVEIGALEIQEGNVLDETAVQVVGAARFVEENRAGKIDGREFAVGTQRAEPRNLRASLVAVNQPGPL